MLLFELDKPQPTAQGILGKLLAWLKRQLIGNKATSYFASFSYYAISRLKLETGKDIADIDKDVEAYETLFYHALVAGCTHEGVQPPTKEQVPGILDANYALVQNMMIESFKALEDQKKKLAAGKNNRMKIVA